MAALFQVSDGLQASAVGALRGLKDTAYPMLVTFFAYWMVGLPLAWILGIAKAFGPRGLWVGLIAGLTIGAVLLSLRFHHITRTMPGTASQDPSRAVPADSSTLARPGSTQNVKPGGRRRPQMIKP